MQSFRTGKTEILVATDVAARGIDVDDVEAVSTMICHRMKNIMFIVLVVPDVPEEADMHFLLSAEKKCIN